MKRLALVGMMVFAGCRAKVTPDQAQGFGSKVERLDGTYGVARGGIVEPALKVELTKTGYVFEERPHGEWETDPEVPHTATEEEVTRGVGKVSVPVFGLATGRILLLKMPPGWTSGAGVAVLSSGAQGKSPVVTKSGFLIVSGGAMVAAEKVQLGGR